MWHRYSKPLYIYICIKSQLPFFSIDTFLIVGPYSSIQKTQFEIISFPPERRVNVCSYRFFHINWPCAAFLLSELKSAERASPVQVSVASFYYTHFKDRLLRRNTAWMTVNSDTGDKAQWNCSVCIPICRFPHLQVLCYLPSLYICTLHIPSYVISWATAICISHTAVITSNTAINILFFFGFILGLDIVWVSDSWQQGTIPSSQSRSPSFTTTDVYQRYNHWWRPTTLQRDSALWTRICISTCFLFLCIPSSTHLRMGWEVNGRQGKRTLEGKRDANQQSLVSAVCQKHLRGTWMWGNLSLAGDVEEKISFLGGGQTWEENVKVTRSWPLLCCLRACSCLFPLVSVLWASTELELPGSKAEVVGI